MHYISDRQRQIIDAFLILVAESDEPKKITMSMVAERAGLRRQSIYEKHFTSIADIIQTTHTIVSEECEEKMQEFFATTYNDYNGDFFVFFEQEILPLLYGKRDWLKILYSAVLDAAWADYAQKVYTPYIELYLTKRGNNSGLPDDFICNLITRQVIAIVANWLTGDSPEPASLFQKKFDYLIKTSTYDLLFAK
ncbi:TetR/AcrR family transcriptional regulator [Lactovum odontotermitis]